MKNIEEYIGISAKIPINCGHKMIVIGSRLMQISEQGTGFGEFKI